MLIKVRSRFLQWVAEREALRFLESLEDHHLQDMGISRSSIRAAVRLGLAA